MAHNWSAFEVVFYPPLCAESQSPWVGGVGQRLAGPIVAFTTQLASPHQLRFPLALSLNHLTGFLALGCISLN